MFPLPAWVTGPIVKSVGAFLLVAGVLGYTYHRGGDGPRAELEGYLAVQKIVSDQAVAERKRLKRNVEKVNEAHINRNAVLSHELARLRNELDSRPVRGPIGVPAETKRPDLVAFDRAEFDRAVQKREREEREFEARVLELVGEGAKAVVDLDTAKDWARGDQ